MRIADVVIFKSTPYFYFKEKTGVKNNTLRKFISEDAKDVNRKGLLDLFILGKIELDVRIINTETGESFERQIKDVSIYDDWYIITWRT